MTKCVPSTCALQYALSLSAILSIAALGHTRGHRARIVSECEELAFRLIRCGDVLFLEFLARYWCSVFSLPCLERYRAVFQEKGVLGLRKAGCHSRGERSFLLGLLHDGVPMKSDVRSPAVVQAAHHNVSLLRTCFFRSCRRAKASIHQACQRIGGQICQSVLSVVLVPVLVFPCSGLPQESSLA
jgi:hypothetical protein